MFQKLALLLSSYKPIQPNQPGPLEKANIIMFRAVLKCDLYLNGILFNFVASILFCLASVSCSTCNC
jgi:hypothetical protein